MKIAIGIAAWNEEASIGLTLDSLFRQSLFQDSRPEIESIHVVVVANGCTDKTVSRAQAAMERNLNKPQSKATGEVVEIVRPGKSNAWNIFIHEKTPADIDYIFMLDADVIIRGDDTMWSMVSGLNQAPEKVAASALGIKDIELKSKKSLWDRFSIAMTNMERDARLMYICGQLYCGRGKFLKNWSFPEGWVAGDDAWIATMAITNYLTTDYQFDKILYPDGAEFIFEAYTSFSVLFRQHRRRQIGSFVRQIVVDYVKQNQVHGLPDAGLIVRTANSERPEWLRQEIDKRINARGFWVIPFSRVFQRFTQLRGLPFRKKIARLPLAMLGSIWSFAVFTSANRMLKKRTFAKAWQSNPNTRLIERVPLA